MGTRSGGVITYGPFDDLPPTAAVSFQKDEQQKISVHYEYDTPVLSVLSLDRWAEISHWGSNLNIQDDIHIINDGPQ